MNTNKLRTKDIVTVVLMSMINIFIFGFSSLFYFNPFTILLMPVYFGLAQGIVYFILAHKVQKKGAIFIYCLIQGIVTFNLPYILCYLVAGILAEVIFAKLGYGNLKAMTISYIVIQLLNCIGSTIYPYAITLEATLERMPESGGFVSGDFIRKAGEMIQSWGSLILLLVVVLSAYLGAMLGKVILEKHFYKEKSKK